MTPEPSSSKRITSLDDSRAIQILSTEHWSLLSQRALVYNEAFVRGGMFLTFLSTSFVALALLAQAMSFGTEFLSLAAIILAFDLVIGLTTYGRIMAANGDDLRAAHGMARIRHAYAEAAPVLLPYFTSATHDDIEAVLTVYGALPTKLPGQILYAVTTSGGMIALITSMVGGVLTGILGLIVGAPSGLLVWFGVAGAALVMVGLLYIGFRSIPQNQASLQVLFPTPEQPSKAERPSA